MHIATANILEMVKDTEILITDIKYEDACKGFTLEY